MRRPGTTPAGPPKGGKPSTVAPQHRHSTLPRHPLAKQTRRPHPTRRAPTARPAIRAPQSVAHPRRQVGRIIDEDESSLVDLIDNLLSKGVMLNAELILALADVDLIYIRLSALLCAADRVLPRLRPDSDKPTSGGQGSGRQAPRPAK